MLLACGLVSIDAWVVMICPRSQMVSINEEEVVLIDAACFSFRIVHSSLAGSENESLFSLLLMVLQRMHLKETIKKIYVSN